MPRSAKTNAPIKLKLKRSRRAVDALPKRLVTTDQIARRAYEIYESRGRADGAQLEDWLAAERQLLSGADA
jgi:hypothetical protein